MGQFRISTLTVVLSIVVIVGYFGAFGTSMYALNELKVGGPVYGRIVSVKDLTADILPPPAYIIEAYLEATLTLANPADVAKHKARLAQLRKDYTDRHTFWTSQNFDLGLKTQLTKDSDRFVRQFFGIVDDLLPVMPSFMRRVCSGFAPLWGGLRTQSV